jgi:hypothetical protein
MYPPSVEVAVIVAEPKPVAVTSPVESTETDVSLERHVTDLSVALEGVTVADMACELPTDIVRAD